MFVTQSRWRDHLWRLADGEFVGKIFPLGVRITSMATYEVETPVGINVSQLLITQYPRVAKLTFSIGDASFAIQLDNPRPVSALSDALEECYQIRIGDRNADGMQLEFGRFNVELWDEDNPIA